MDMNIEPEAIGLLNGMYTIALRGTAEFAGEIKGWVRVGVGWMSATPVPGTDITFEVDQDDPEEERGTLFEVGIWPRESGPGKGPARWSGKYWAKDAEGGPTVTSAD